MSGGRMPSAQRTCAADALALAEKLKKGYHVHMIFIFIRLFKNCIRLLEMSIVHLRGRASDTCLQDIMRNEAYFCVRRNDE